ncbi:uncharacterized protein LOC142587894 isoform X1 [Dermacentor variabilis]|uniref:uncharacterized protein LOC142587894 isoform X1 n=1 Tax=Dermacentor variabilis TaxID=34621 RepID=UPI003F5C8616
MSDDVYKAWLERSAAAKRRRRAEETEEEREKRRAKQRAYAAAWRARRSASLDAGASTNSGPSLMSGVNGSETMETTSSSETSSMDALNAEETIMDASNGDDAASMNSIERYNFNRRKRRAEETLEQRVERLAKRRMQYAAKKGERNEARRKQRAQEKEERLNNKAQPRVPTELLGDMACTEDCSTRNLPLVDDAQEPALSSHKGDKCVQVIMRPANCSKASQVNMKRKVKSKAAQTKPCGVSIGLG